MKKSMYIMGSIEAILGSVILCVTSVIKELIPQFGRIAFQRAMAGGFSPDEYRVSFQLASTAAVILIVVGIAQMVISFLRKD